MVRGKDVAGISVQNSWSGDGDQKCELGSRVGEVAGVSSSTPLPGPKIPPAYVPAPQPGLLSLIHLVWSSLC